MISIIKRRSSTFAVFIHRNFDMLFNSYTYIFFFLPIAWVVYFSFNQTKHSRAGKVWLVLASLFFYGFFNFSYVPLLIVSIFVNYTVGVALSARMESGTKCALSRRSITIIGIIFNLGLLTYYKYLNFCLYVVYSIDTSIFTTHAQQSGWRNNDTK